MDASELRELATNALTGHWPPHLGVKTDQEKIEYLASKLEEAAGTQDEITTDIQMCADCDLCVDHS